jgi:hypothetical protein
MGKKSTVAFNRDIYAANMNVVRWNHEIKEEGERMHAQARRRPKRILNQSRS